MKNSFCLALVVLSSSFFVLSSIACGNNTPTTPTPTEPVTITDTFTGTLNRNGAADHNFVAGGSGSVTATLTTLNPNPDTTLKVGFAVGTWAAGQCTVIISRAQAVQSTVILGNVNASGELCVRIYDVGFITEPTDYEISVVHP